ncbi:MAG: phytoene desaturase family protein, partial [Bacilli bacterium]
MRKIAIIGAGLGGLSAAALLQKAGFSVTVFEKNAHPGGKLAKMTVGNSVFDFGPNTITMPEVFQNILTQCGYDHSKLLKFIPLHTHTRNFFPDGMIWDWSNNPTSMIDEVRTFNPTDAKNFPELLAEIKKMATIAKKEFFYRTFTSWRDYTSPSLAAGMLSVHPLTNMNAFWRKYIKDERLIQALNRY